MKELKKAVLFAMTVFLIQCHVFTNWTHTAVQWYLKMFAHMKFFPPKNMESKFEPYIWHLISAKKLWGIFLGTASSIYTAHPVLSSECRINSSLFVILLFVNVRTLAVFAMAVSECSGSLKRILQVWLTVKEHREHQWLLINPTLCFPNKGTKEQSRI